MAQIVPIGMDFCASAKSPDLLEPAMIPNESKHELRNYYACATLRLVH